MNGSPARGVLGEALAALVLAAGSAAGDLQPAAEETAPPAAVSTVSYEVPAISLTRADGREVSLPVEMDDGRPVLLNFVFTSCTAICPLMTQTFSWFQRGLAASDAPAHLMSISIDPEQDTPERLREYAERFGARPGWDFYTGSVAASITAQQAFGAYRGNKMGHEPVTLMRAAPGAPWQRLAGFQKPEELLRAYRALTARP